jgi:hypothetical protein
MGCDICARGLINVDYQFSITNESELSYLYDLYVYEHIDWINSLNNAIHEVFISNIIPQHPTFRSRLERRMNRRIDLLSTVVERQLTNLSFPSALGRSGYNDNDNSDDLLPF